MQPVTYLNTSAYTTHSTYKGRYLQSPAVSKIDHEHICKIGLARHSIPTPWCAAHPSPYTCSELMSQTECPLQFRLAAIHIDPEGSRPVRRQRIALATPPSPNQCLSRYLHTYYRRLRQARKTRTRPDQAREGVRETEDIQKRAG
jgi:hypothetical protein